VLNRLKGVERAACIGLAVVPVACALGGVALDEYWQLGYTNWLSACRNGPVSLASLAWFTLELMPSAVIGLLLGGLAVQLIGLSLRHRPVMLQASLAAHAGCALGMAAGLLLCTLALPLQGTSPWMLVVAEAALASFTATWLLRRIRNVPYAHAAKCVVGPISASCAATQNSRNSGGRE